MARTIYINCEHLDNGANSEGLLLFKKGYRYIDAGGWFVSPEDFANGKRGELVRYEIDAFELESPRIVRELRERAGMTQARFSEAYGFSKRAVEEWENGRRTPPVYLISLLAFAIECDLLTN